jgi:large repetitive protein
MKKGLLFFLLFLPFLRSHAQCGGAVPVFTANLAGVPDSVWTSPSVIRNDNCCGTTAPDVCVKFIITLDSSAVAINFNIISGAVPGGALFYQINCGTPQALGTPICLNGPGPHILTFCKPGNNANVYQITSVPAPIGGTDVTVNDGCTGQLTATGFDPATTTWNSIFPGSSGAYNSYLSCTSGCINPTVTSQSNPPAFVDYVVCGTPAALCFTGTVCDTIRVYFNPTLIVSVQPSNPTICFGQTSTNITAVGTGGVPPYTYSWSNGGSTSTIAVGAGNYSVILSDASGCPPVSTGITVTQYTVPVTANAGANQTICAQNPVAVLNGSVTGASGGIWSGGTGTFSPSNTTLTNVSYTPSAAEIASGIVNLTLTTTGMAPCAPASDAVQITIQNFIASVALTPSSVSCFGGNNGSITATVTGNPAPFTYSWTSVPSQTGSVATGLTAGAYSVTVTDAIGCTFTTGATVTQPPPLNLVGDPDNVLCNGGNSGAVVVAVSGGTPAYSYNWQPGGQNTSSITNLTAGNYSVTVTDAKGCILTSSFAITQPATTVHSFSIVNVSCFGYSDGQLSVISSGGTAPYSYSWSNGLFGSSLVGLPAGGYTLTATDANGCVTTATTSITQPTAVSAVVSSTNETCSYLNNGSATVAGTGGTPAYVYSWQPGSMSGSSVTNLASGTYSLNVTDSKGCVYVTFITITQPNPLTLNFINQVNVSCNGGNNGSVTANVTGGITGYTYTWSPNVSNGPTANTLSAGTYSLTITDNNGCTVANTVTITQPPFPLNVSISNSAVSCNGGSNGSLNSFASGGTGPYSYLWTPGGFTGSSVTNIPAGNYAVTVTDAKGCTASGNTIITQPPPIILTTSSVNSNCGFPNGSASVAVSGGSSPYLYQWAPSGGNSATANGLASGAYTITVTDNSGCLSTNWVNVNDNSGPVANIISTTNVSCFGGSNGSAQVGTSGGTGPYSFFWSPSGGTDSIANGLTAGTYTVTVLDANGCQSLATTSPAITQPAQLALSTSTTNVSCFGGANGAASVSASGGIPGYTFQWLPSGATGSSTSGLNAGTFSVQVTDANGCQFTQSYTITQPTALTASVTSSTNINCFGGNNGTASATVSGGTPNYFYNWFPTGGNGPSAIGLTAGSYTVFATDSKGCTTTSSVTLTQPTQALSATVSSVATSCFGASDGTATANPAGGTSPYTFTWFPSGGTNSTATGLSASNYTVQVSDAQGCLASAAVAVGQPMQIGVTLSASNPSCGNNNGFISSQVSGGTAPYTYQWLPGGATSSSISGLAPGTYTLNVTDFRGCTTSITSTLTNIAGPALSVVSLTNVLCNGGNTGSATVNISSGTAPYFVSWSPYGGNNTTASGLIAGTYTVTVTDVIGCIVTTPVLITQPLQLAVAVNSSSAPSCNGGSNGSASVLVSGGTPNYNYTWQPFGGNTSTGTNLTAGGYTVIVNDNNGCSNSVSLVITQPTQVASSIGTSSNPTCFGSTNGSATGNASGGTAPYAFAWSTTPVQTSNQAIGLTAGNYTLTVTDANGCISTTSVTLTQPVQVNTVAGVGDTICLGTSGTISASATGGSGSYFYYWNPPAANNSSSQSVSPGVSTDYTVTASDQNGCSGASSIIHVEVYVLNGASVQAFASSPICLGQSSTIYVQTSGTTGPLTYSWSNNLGNTAGAFLVTPLVPTTYYVTVSNTCGVSVTDSVQVQFNSPPTISIGTDTTLGCQPVTVNFTDLSVTGNPNDPIAFWTWSFGDGTSSSSANPVHTYNASGNYSVTLSVSTVNGCTSNNASGPLVVNVYPVPNAAFSVNDVTLNVPYDVLNAINQSTGASSYSWSFGDGGTSTAVNPSHLYGSVGIFTVQLVAANNLGCSDTASITITTTAEVVFPNAFTPNTSGPTGGSYDINSLSNDIFFPYTAGVTEYHLLIFNRWGELIFESKDIKQGWDGYYRSKLCPQDVYVWKATVKLNNGKTFKKTGDVTLLR